MILVTYQRIPKLFRMFFMLRILRASCESVRQVNDRPLRKREGKNEEEQQHPTNG